MLKALAALALIVAVICGGIFLWAVWPPLALAALAGGSFRLAVVLIDVETTRQRTALKEK